MNVCYVILWCYSTGYHYLLAVRILFIAQKCWNEIKDNSLQTVPSSPCFLSASSNPIPRLSALSLSLSLSHPLSVTWGPSRASFYPCGGASCLRLCTEVLKNHAISYKWTSRRDFRMFPSTKTPLKDLYTLLKRSSYESLFLCSLPLPMSEASVHPCCATRRARATATSDTDEAIISLLKQQKEYWLSGATAVMVEHWRLWHFFSEKQ